MSRMSKSSFATQVSADRFSGNCDMFFGAHLAFPQRDPLFLFSCLTVRFAGHFSPPSGPQIQSYQADTSSQHAGCSCSSKTRFGFRLSASAGGICASSFAMQVTYLHIK